MAYDLQSTYIKFNAECSCEDKEHCTCGCKDDDKCGCCPVGLVSIQDASGVNIGCVSPNDAQIYMANTFKCPDGFIRVMDDSTPPVFLGCLSVEDYAAYLAALG